MVADCLGTPFRAAGFRSYAPHAWLGVAQEDRGRDDILRCPLGNRKVGRGLPPPYLRPTFQLK